jgi:chromosome segregation ATPase
VVVLSDSVADLDFGLLHQLEESQAKKEKFSQDMNGEIAGIQSRLEAQGKHGATLIRESEVCLELGSVPARADGRRFDFTTYDNGQDFRQSLGAILNEMDEEEGGHKRMMDATGEEIKALEEEHLRLVAATEEQQARAKEFKDKAQAILESEVGLRERLEEYNAKFDSFQETLTQSNVSFHAAKDMMDKLSKEIKVRSAAALGLVKPGPHALAWQALERERKVLRGRADRAEHTVTDLQEKLRKVNQDVEAAQVTRRDEWLEAIDLATD